MAPRAARNDSPIKADALTPAEQAYFESSGQGDSPIVELPPKEPAPEPELPLAEEPEAPEPPAAAEPVHDKTVPLRALTEAREETKEWKNRFATLEQRTNLLLERFGQQQQPAQPQPVKQAGDELPDPQKDPAGHLLGLMRLQGETVQQVAQRQQYQEQQQQVASQIGQLQTVAVAAEQEFAAQTPDYNDAAQYLQSFRSRQLEALGYPPQQRSAMMAQEALSLAAQAFQRGENPASVIYKMAKVSGYAPKAADEPPAADGQPVQNDETIRKLQTVNKGQGQSLSLSGARGAAPKQMSAQRLLEMNETEWEAFASKNPKEFRDMMGN